MRKAKLNEVKIHFTKYYPHILSDDKGQPCKVGLQMYTGKIKYRLKGFDEFLPVKAYGLNIVILTDGSKEPTSYDFGFLSSEGYQVGALIHALARADVRNFDHLRKAIRLEASSWGDPVYDIEGQPIYIEGGRLKRDPFVRAAKRVLKGLLAKAQKRIADADIMQTHSGKGVGL